MHVYLLCKYTTRNAPKVGALHSTDSMSFSILSRASKQYLFNIGASSHMIEEHRRSSVAFGHPCLILHVECSNRFNGSENRECAVLPPGSSNDAIPLEITFSTIFPFVRSPADKVFQMYVLPVPPY